MCKRFAQPSVNTTQQHEVRATTGMFCCVQRTGCGMREEARTHHMLNERTYHGMYIKTRQLPGPPLKTPDSRLHTVQCGSQQPAPCPSYRVPKSAPITATLTEEGLAMNKNVAEAARRIFGNLPHSNVRTGNKVLRKNIIGRKIAEVCTSVPTHCGTHLQWHVCIT